MYKFCKRCGCVGLYTINFLVSERDVFRRIRSRIERPDSAELSVLYHSNNYPLYTNLIQGTPDRLHFRNVRINLFNLGFKNNFGGRFNSDGYGSEDDGMNLHEAEFINNKGTSSGDQDVFSAKKVGDKAYENIGYVDIY